MISGCEDAG